MKRKSLPNAMFKAFFRDQVEEINSINSLNSYNYFIKHYMSHGSEYNMTNLFRVSQILPIYFTSLQLSEITAKV